MKKNILFVKNQNKQELLNFGLFSLGKFISVFGTAIYAFAIGLYVLKATGSGLSFATTLLFSILPVVIFGPFSGVIADKFDKKKTIILMDTLNAVLFMVLFFISSIRQISLPIIYVSTFISTTLTTVFGTSIEAAKPHLVSNERLISLNSLSRIIDSASSILAPLIGGIIFAFINLKLFIMFNAFSFLFSAVLEIFIDFQFNPPKENEDSQGKINFISDITEGFKFILKRQDIKKIIGILVTINFFLSLSATVPLPYIISNVLKFSARDFGIIEGMFPLGIIIGALLVKRVINKYSYDSIMLFTSIMLSVFTILLGIPLAVNFVFSNTSYLVYYIVVSIVLGIIISFIDIPILFRLQKTVEDAYRGRVLSTGTSMGKIVQPLAYILSGLLLNSINPSILVIGGGLLMLISTLIIQKNKNYSEKSV